MRTAVSFVMRVRVCKVAGDVPNKDSAQPELHVPGQSVERRRALGPKAV